MNWKRILIGKWSWKRPFYSLAFIYGILFVIAVFFADRLIFIPPDSSYPPDLSGLEILADKDEDSLAFLHLKARPGMPTFLYSHGNAEDIGQSLELFQEWNVRGFGVLAYDYPGYGLSTGKPTENSVQSAALRAWGHLIESGVSEKSIVIVGRSVGSGPSVWLASSRRPAGLILISPFKSTFSVAFPVPLPLFPRDRFPNLTRIRKITTPLLIIHGKNDEVIPFSHGKSLFENSPALDKKFVPIPDAGHNDLFSSASEKIIAETSAFASRVSGLAIQK